MNTKFLIPKDVRFHNLLGKTFGEWTVTSYRGKRGRFHIWLCVCQCGRKQVVYGNNLSSGKSKRCSECRVRTMSISRQGSASRFPKEHSSWSKMKSRCSNRKGEAWRNYGGRGIKVCQRWVESFDNFLSDMGPKPSPFHDIDRFPDNNGDYEPGNCRWATRKENANNTRKNRFITIKEETKTLSEWCGLYGINRKTVSDRLERGWTLERAFKTPSRFNRQWHS